MAPTDRIRLIEALGGRCVWPGCGIDDVEMLQLDHINSDGATKRGVPFAYYLRHLDYTKTVLQVLCANHNWKKRYHTKQGTPTGGAPPTETPLETQFQNRVGALTTWASTNQTVMTTISTNALTATTIIADQALSDYTVTRQTARNYAHAVVLNLTSST